MKKKLLFAAFALSIFMTGCSNKNAEPVVENNLTAIEASEKSTDKTEVDSAEVEDSTSIIPDAVIVKDAHIQGAIFAGEATDNIPVKAGFNPAWITTTDNTVYNKNLAKFCVLATADTYFKEKDLAAGTVNRVLFDDANEAEYTITAFLEEMGFEDVEFVESFRKKEYTENTNDSATFIMAYENVDNKYDTFAFIFRGIYSSAEWYSILGPGEAGEYHEGIDIASKRAMEFMEEYMASHDNNEGEDCVLITGHSRGGSIANLIGATMEENENVRSYTYTLSAVPSVYNTKEKDYKTIFNLADKRDFFINGLSFGDMDPVNYGTDIYVNIADSIEIKDKINALKERADYAFVSNEEIEKYMKLWHERFPKRSELYDNRSITEEYDTEKEAIARAEELSSLIGSENGLGIDIFVDIKEIEQLPSGKFKVEIIYSDAGLLYSYSKILAYGNAAADAVMNIFKEDEGGYAIAECLRDNLSAISSGHKSINLYAATSLQ